MEHQKQYFTESKLPVVLVYGILVQIIGMSNRFWRQAQLSGQMDLNLIIPSLYGMHNLSCAVCSAFHIIKHKSIQMYFHCNIGLYWACVPFSTCILLLMLRQEGLPALILLFLFSLQTGAGKTYTLSSISSADNIGMMPRAASHLFSEIAADPVHAYNVVMAYVQIYNESIQVGACCRTALLLGQLQDIGQVAAISPSVCCRFHWTIYARLLTPATESQIESK